MFNELTIERDIYEFRINTLNAELQSKGWSHTEIMNLCSVKDLTAPNYYDQKMADKHFNGDINAYNELNNRYRAIWIDAIIVGEQMRKRRFKRVSKATLATYEAMKAEYDAALSVEA